MIREKKSRKNKEAEEEREEEKRRRWQIGVEHGWMEGMPEANLGPESREIGGNC